MEEKPESTDLLLFDSDTREIPIVISAVCPNHQETRQMQHQEQKLRQQADLLSIQQNVYHVQPQSENRQDKYRYQHPVHPLQTFIVLHRTHPAGCFRKNQTARHSIQQGQIDDQIGKYNPRRPG